MNNGDHLRSPLIIYSFIPLLFFGCTGCRIDCRSLSYCSLNHWLRVIRFAVRVSRLSLSRRICKGVLSVANHRLCSEENSRPVKFTILGFPPTRLDTFLLCCALLYSSISITHFFNFVLVGSPVSCKKEAYPGHPVPRWIVKLV